MSGKHKNYIDNGYRPELLMLKNDRDSLSCTVLRGKGAVKPLTYPVFAILKPLLLKNNMVNKGNRQQFTTTKKDKTMDEYEKWEKDCKKIKQQNKKILDNFTEWLEESGVKENTINKHYRNVDFYINEFLLYEDAIPAKDGVSSIGMFLGYWFIKKAMWSSVAAIKQNATSLKKFYQFMMERKEIKVDEFEELKKDIKENMQNWLERMERYDDPEIEDMDEVWGF